MPKLKFNEEKCSFTLKGLDVNHLILIRAILNITRLGSEDIYKEAAYELLDTMDSEIGDHDWWEDCHVGFSSTPDEGFVLEVNDTFDPEECNMCQECCSGCN